MSEAALHRTVAQYLDLALPANCVWSTVGHGGFPLPVRTAARLKASGLKAGVPDLMLIFGGKPYFIEIKTPLGKLSRSQQEMHARLRAAGAQVAVCRSVEEVRDALKGWGIVRGKA